jgi:hypothetical protein
VLCRRFHAALEERDSKRALLCLHNYRHQCQVKGSDPSSTDQLQDLFGEVIKMEVRRQEEAEAAVATAAAAAAALEQDATAAPSRSSSRSSSRTVPEVQPALLPMVPLLPVAKPGRQPAPLTSSDTLNTLIIGGSAKAAANLAQMKKLYQQQQAGYAVGWLNPVWLFCSLINWAVYCYIYCCVQVLSWSHGRPTAAAAAASVRSIVLMIQLHRTHDAAAILQPERPDAGTSHTYVWCVLLADLPPRQSSRVLFAHTVLHNVVLTLALLPTLVLVVWSAVSC